MWLIYYLLIETQRMTPRHREFEAYRGPSDNATGLIVGRQRFFAVVALLLFTFMLCTTDLSSAAYPAIRSDVANQKSKELINTYSPNTLNPTRKPSSKPTTEQPTNTLNPTRKPSIKPKTGKPTNTLSPTHSPSMKPAAGQTTLLIEGKISVNVTLGENTSSTYNSSTGVPIKMQDHKVLDKVKTYNESGLENAEDVGIQIVQGKENDTAVEIVTWGRDSEIKRSDDTILKGNHTDAGIRVSNDSKHEEKISGSIVSRNVSEETGFDSDDYSSKMEDENIVIMPEDASEEDITMESSATIENDSDYDDEISGSFDNKNVSDDTSLDSDDYNSKMEDENIEIMPENSSEEEEEILMELSATDKEAEDLLQAINDALDETQSGIDEA